MNINPFTWNATVTFQSGSGNITFNSGTSIFGGNALTVITSDGGDITLDTITAGSILARTTGGTAASITLSGELTVSGSGNAVVIDAGTSGGNFINTYGTGAIDLTNGGTKRWIVYSTDSTSDTPDGLSAAQTIYSETYGTEAPGSVPNAGENTWVYSASNGGGGGGSTNLGTLYITALRQMTAYGSTPDTSPLQGTTYSCTGIGSASPTSAVRRYSQLSASITGMLALTTSPSTAGRCPSITAIPARSTSSTARILWPHPCRAASYQHSNHPCLELAMHPSPCETSHYVGVLATRNPLVPLEPQNRETSHASNSETPQTQAFVSYKECIDSSLSTVGR